MTRRFGEISKKIFTKKRDHFFQPRDDDSTVRRHWVYFCSLQQHIGLAPGAGRAEIDAFYEKYATFDRFFPRKSTLELTFPAFCASKTLTFEPNNLVFSKFKHQNAPPRLTTGSTPE
jgi:hypothetical protein